MPSQGTEMEKIYIIGKTNHCNNNDANKNPLCLVIYIYILM